MKLILLIASIVLAVLVVVAVRALARQIAAIEAAVSVFHPRELTPYELAYLEGDAWDTAFTAIAIQVEAGMLRLSRDGRIHLVRSHREPRDPLDEQVLQLVAGHPAGLDAHLLRDKVWLGPYMDILRRRLVDDGLLRPPGFFRLVDRWLTTVAALGWTAAAVALGVLWAALTTRVTPLSVLTTCVLATVMLTALIAWNRYERKTRQRCRTPAGEEILEAAKRDNPRDTAEGPVAMALYGLRRDELYYALLDLRRPSSPRGTGASGGGGGGDGGGCGGGCGGP
ncbi:TIGR04222 domain-containing membrane protein [Nonomuraea sp. B19D2]|uniref:TIGR04222 domain-containing membrane protein n=1 Tax=Nonomuraea sp. B19D2 TaxID=3159561 RepID=UPI0032DA3D32